VVYNCTAPATQILPLDLDRPKPCPEVESIFAKPRNVTVQILQTATRHPIRAYQCEVMVSQEVCRCGIESTHYGCQWPVLEHALEVTPAECRRAVSEGKLTVNHRELEVEVGVKRTVQYYSHGSLDKDGNCEHTSFTSGGVHFVRSYERTMVTYRVKLARAMVDLAKGDILFNNGIRARYRDGVTRDQKEGTLVWTPEDPPCHDTVSEVYLGPAKLHDRTDTEEGGEPGPALVVVEREDTEQYAGLLLEKVTSACTVHGYATQLPGIVVIILRLGDSPLPKAAFKDHAVEQINQLQTQLAFLHVTRGISVEEQFAALWMRLCEVERTNMYLRLHDVATGKNPYALLDTHGRGHTVTEAGQAAYVASCQPMEATLGRYHNCTREIPVMLEGSDKLHFADPFTRVLKRYPTEVVCDEVMPIRWKINGTWRCATPGPVVCDAPVQLDPSRPMRRLDDFTTGLGRGVYSAHQLQAHQKYLLDLETREAVLSKAAHDAASSPYGGDQRLGPPLSLQDIHDLTYSIGSHIMPFFGWLGDVWRYLCGGYIVGLTLKCGLDFLLRIHTLWRERGIGWWMLACVWDSVFYLIRIPVVILEDVTKQFVTPIDHGEDKRVVRLKRHKPKLRRRTEADEELASPEALTSTAEVRTEETGDHPHRPVATQLRGLQPSQPKSPHLA